MQTHLSYGLVYNYKHSISIPQILKPGWTWRHCNIPLKNDLPAGNTSFLHEIALEPKNISVIECCKLTTVWAIDPRQTTPNEGNQQFFYLCWKCLIFAIVCIVISRIFKSCFVYYKCEEYGGEICINRYMPIKKENLQEK